MVKKAKKNSENLPGANKARNRSTRAYLLRLCLGVMIVLVTAVCTNLYFQQEEEYQRLHLEQEQLQRQMSSLYEEYDDLCRQYEMLDSDEYIESIARDYLNMCRPEDTLIISK
ncbi:MAG: septum formation initiator family protein [Eubacteriales bacterium]|nr:septum formation initiator family protein [Eubacteriales bacterium]MDD4323931.1 septum formation initiator family protein [Eubacteriales bacterium]MDD4540598.1 septum formation initiator family protein [Eubacteriales bacterium]